MVEISKEFIARCEPIFKNEIEDFIHSLSLKSRSSIRLNTSKKEHQLDLGNPIPWCSNGFYLNQKPTYTLDPFFHAGHYYPQEASSMIIEQVIRQIKLDDHSLVLDLCAAPGGKSTHLIDLLSSTSLIHSHETISLRAETLRQNVEKWGRPNVCVSTGKIDHIISSGIKYDLILIDAPCSGEGMFRKENDALKQWNLQKVNHCISLQNEISQYAIQLLKPNGYILYSTCTYNRQENEFILQKLISKHELESVALEFNQETNVLENRYEDAIVYRCAPHRMEGEGFTFGLLKNKKIDTQIKPQKRISKIVKSQFSELDKLLQNSDEFEVSKIGEMNYAIPIHWLDFFHQMMQSRLKILNFGIRLGHHKGKDWFPDHALSQSIFIQSKISRINLELNEALHYLRADNAYLPEALNSDIWQLVCYQSAILGWVKRIDKKLKNYLPKNQRIHSL